MYWDKLQAWQRKVTIWLHLQMVIFRACWFGERHTVADTSDDENTQLQIILYQVGI